MELKLTVSIGATLQVKNAKGEWDWIKPEVGAEVLLLNEEVQPDYIQEQFGKLWDNIVGPQFKNVVNDLIVEPLPSDEENDDSVDATETVASDEDEYY